MSYFQKLYKKIIQEEFNLKSLNKYNIKKLYMEDNDGEDDDEEPENDNSSSSSSNSSSSNDGEDDDEEEPENDNSSSSSSNSSSSSSGSSSSSSSSSSTNSQHQRGSSGSQKSTPKSQFESYLEEMFKKYKIDDLDQKVIKDYLTDFIICYAKQKGADKKKVSIHILRYLKKSAFKKIKVYNQKKEIIDIDLQKFLDNAEKYDEYLSADAKAAKEKQDSDTKEKQRITKQKKFNEFKEKALEFQNDFPASKVAESFDGRGDNDLYGPMGFILRDIKNKPISTYNSDDEIDSDSEIQDVRAFLNLRWKTDKLPVHPLSYAKFIHATIDFSKNKNVDWDVNHFKKICIPIANEAEKLAKQYPEFPCD